MRGDGIIMTIIRELLDKYSDTVFEFAQVLRDESDRISNTYLSEEKLKDFSMSTGVSEKISFLSHGFAVPNNIMLLLDLHAKNPDVRSRMLLIDMACNIIDEMPKERQKELLVALNAKYGVNYNNKLYSAIIERIEYDT